MRRTRRSLPRVLIVLLLYPWIVGFSGSPRDSLATKISVYGGLGQYDVITRDCNNQITSVTQIPFQEAGASLEGAIAGGIGYKMRGGYSNFQSNRTRVNDSIYFYTYTSNNFPPQNLYYGGLTFRFQSDFFGFDIGGLLTNRTLNFTRFYKQNQNAALTGGLRVGYLDAWYGTLDFLNGDPLISSGAMYSSGIGFALGSMDQTKHGKRPSTLWFGLGLGPYDGPMALAKLTLPFDREWTAEFSVGVSTAANFEGAFSGGLGYSW